MSDIFFERKVIVNQRVKWDVHYHETYELYYLVEGKVKYFVNDKFFYLDSGNLIIIPKKILHSTDSENCLHNERLLLTFPDSIFSPEIAECLNSLCQDNLICIKPEKLPIIEDMLYKISHEYSGNNPLKEDVLKLYISELMVYLYRYKTTPRPKKPEVDVTMQRVADYIFANFSEDLSLPRLCEIFSLSGSYLSRRFKSEMGLSITQYTNYIRVSKAKELLKKPFDTITQIALACGYNDSNYFTANFKKLTGLTPLKYSKQYVS